MQILPANIPPEGKPYRGEEPAGLLELGETAFVENEGPVGYDLSAEMAGTELLVRGRVWCDLTVSCSRCAESFTVHVAEPAFVFSRSIEDESESVDLTPDMREATILAFPAYPVCKSDCAGLCPSCGKNLNTGRCACEPRGDDHWGALENLKLE